MPQFRCRATDVNFTVLDEEIVDEVDVESWKAQAAAQHSGALLVTWEVDENGVEIPATDMPGVGG